MLVFPSGHLPNDRWRRSVWPLAAGTTVTAVATAFAPGPMAEGQPMNPLGIEALTPLVGPLQAVGLLLFFIGTIGSGAALIARFRRSEGVEREQLKWFGFAAIVLVIALCVAIVGGAIEPIAVVGYTVVFAALFCLPLAIGVAVMRYRLYEIDRLINRTLVYVPLTAIVAGGYAASVALLQRVFQAVTGDTSDAAIVLSTLFLAAVFTPIRKWLEGLVDERFKPVVGAPGQESVALDQPTGDPWEARMETIARRVLNEYMGERGSQDF
jgi:hypothetical protein